MTFRPGRLAWFIWLLGALLISVLVWLQPLERTVTPIYRSAAEAWVERAPLYTPEQLRGYYNLPQFALLYRPFAALPVPVGAILWRIVSLAVLATGVRRLVLLAPTDQAARRWLGATLLVLPATLSAARNGQSNLLLAGLMCHAVSALAMSRWWRAAALLTLSLASKQLGLVMILLAPFGYRRVAGPLAGGLALLFLLPFAAAPAAYVWEQYGLLADTMTAQAPAPEHRFCDFNGALHTLGIHLPAAAALAIRLAAALLTLAVWWRTARRIAEPARALLLLGLAAVYLMLFNPMTETNSYVILAPAVAAFAIWRGPPRGLLIAIAIGLGSENLGDPIFPLTDLWLKAVLAAVFGVLLLREVHAADPALPRRL